MRSGRRSSRASSSRCSSFALVEKREKPPGGAREGRCESRRGKAIRSSPEMGYAFPSGKKEQKEEPIAG
ncbi:hypothetical protein GN956_G23565 [Arapaima gigas]